MCVGVCMCMYMQVCVYMYICVYIYVYVYVYIYMYVYVCVCICIWITLKPPGLNTKRSISKFINSYSQDICVCMRWFINSITKRYFSYLYAVKIAINNTTK